MSASKFTILLYYKYTEIKDPQAFMYEQQTLAKKLGLKGRVIIANEGINGTLEGLTENIQEYCAELSKDPRFGGTHFKLSDGDGNSFPKLAIKVRSEIVSSHLGAQDLNPNKVTGKYLQPEELHQWIKEGKEFYIVDMRNDYEQEVGHFKGSIFSGMENFRDLAKTLENLKHLKDKTILTVCTGGVRCEKASGFLVQNDFKDVYQLYGGIVSYMEKYPNQDFLGKLYVFDGRIIMGFNNDDPNYVMVGKCSKCKEPSENYINCANDECHKHIICCEDCISASKGAFCSDKCARIYFREAQKQKIKSYFTKLTNTLVSAFKKSPRRHSRGRNRERQKIRA